MQCVVCHIPARAALCDLCGDNPDATRAHIADVLALCARNHERLLGALSTEDTQRFLNVKKGRRAAAANGRLEAWEARYQAAMERGDALSDMLSADATLQETRAWAERAGVELDALQVEVAV